MATISGKEFFGGGDVQVVQSASAPTINIPNKEERKKSYLERVGGTIAKSVEEAGGAIEQGAELMAGAGVTTKTPGERVEAPIRGAVRAGLGVAGATARAIFSPLTEAIAPIIEPVIKEGIEKSPTAQKALQDLNVWAEAHPEAAANLKDFMDIAASATGAKAGTAGIEAGMKVGKQATEKIISTGKQAVEKTMEALTPDAAQIMQRVARVSKGKQASFEKEAGESIGQFLDKRGIYGDIENISSQLYNRFTTSKSAADNALAKLDGVYKAKPVETALGELLGRETRISTPGALSKDFARVRELSNKYRKEGLSMSEINEVKRLYERNVRLDYMKQNLPESVAKANTIDDALRSWQFGQAEKLGLKNLPEINKETRLTKKLMDDIGKEYAGSAGNNAITLTDWIVLSNGDPAAISAFLVKKGFSDKTIQSAIAKYISKTEKIGMPEAEFGSVKPDMTDFFKK